MFVCMQKNLCKQSYPVKDMCDLHIKYIYSLKNMCV